MRARRVARATGVWLLALAASAHGALDLSEMPATAQDLRERYAALPEDAATPPGLPLRLLSEQRADALRGDVYSQLEHPFAAVRDVLRRPGRWCEIMILHPNVKGCAAAGAPGDERGRIDVRLGRAGHEVAFAFAVVKAADDYLDVRLEAPTGPAGTTDYRIRVEAAPLAGGRTLIHLAYSHGYGAGARLAMQAYFNTFGRDKVGFTVVGRDGEGRPRYVGDLRGGLERNAMRYYLAIRSYLEAAPLPLAQRLEQGLAHFIAYTRRWPRQLAEAPDFADVKRRDFARLRTGP